MSLQQIRDDDVLFTLYDSLVVAKYYFTVTPMIIVL
jgi:hypothetical protein